MTDTSKPSHVRIPGYTILKEIGRGGVATVYLAIQESLEREVALKIMSPALAAEPNFTERFIREGRTIAQLTHPGIVTIYDISVADYQHYIAMEYLSDGSLKRRMHKPIAPAPALAVLRQVASALAFAHRKGFVHRDVKPENIIFRDPNKPVLTDFGIAKQTSDSETHLTSIGVIVGTPRYMSPEQADGRGTDPRSDIYALGVLLYEMLAGRPPYHAKESIALLYSHINDPIPSLPEDSIAFLQPLVNDLLAKDPAQRVQSCEAVVERIRQAQREVRDTERVITPPPSSDTRPVSRDSTLRLRPKRNAVLPIAAWVGAGLAALVVAAALIRGLTGDGEAPDTTSGVVDANVSPRPEPVVVDLPAPQPAEPAPAIETKELESATIQVQTERPVTPAVEKNSTSSAKPVSVKPTQTPKTTQQQAAKTILAPTAPQTAKQPLAPSTPLPRVSSNIVTPEVVLPEPKIAPPVATVSVGSVAEDHTLAAASTAPPAQTAPISNRSAKLPAAATTTLNTRGWVFANEEKISDLLARAQKQIDQDRLSYPPGDNALETFHAVLKSAPNNAQAKAGLQHIAAQYLRLANQATAQKKFTNAQAYIERGLTAVPGHPELRALNVSVEKRIRAEKDFAAAENYYYGNNLSKDLRQAAKLYLSAADKGHVTAQYHLAVAYGNGIGVDKNEREALRWLQVAAAQGNFDAQYNLGLGLIFGPTPDPAIAARWISALAELNYKPAFRLLGWMYTTGTGVEHSISKSVRWAAKGVISNPVGPSPRPDWVVTSWQQRFDAAYARDVNQPIGPSTD